jgi:hypothetical protein
MNKLPTYAEPSFSTDELYQAAKSLVQRLAIEHSTKIDADFYDIYDRAEGMFRLMRIVNDLGYIKYMHQERERACLKWFPKEHEILLDLLHDEKEFLYALVQCSFASKEVCKLVKQDEADPANSGFTDPRSGTRRLLPIFVTAIKIKKLE